MKDRIITALIVACLVTSLFSLAGIAISLIFISKDAALSCLLTFVLAFGGAVLLSMVDFGSKIGKEV